MNYGNEGEYPQGWKNLAGKRRGIKRAKEETGDESSVDTDSDTNLSSSSSDGSIGSLDEEAAALERQFQQN